MAEGDNGGAHGFWATVKKYAKRVWAYLKVAKMEYIVMISLFVLDLVTKEIVSATMSVGQVVPIIPHFISFCFSLNKNAAFGNTALGDWLGSLGSRLFFSIFSVIASVAFVIILVRNKGKNKLFRIALAMLTAGAMGNGVERMFVGYVRDFIRFEFDFFPFIFNVADIELVIGVILMIVYFLFLYNDKDDKKHAAENSDDVQSESDNVNAENLETAENADGTVTDAAPAADNAESDDSGATSDNVESDSAETVDAQAAIEPENAVSEADGE